MEAPKFLPAVELLRALIPPTGIALHGTSTHREGLIAVNGFNSTSVKGARDPEYTYYSIIGPHRMGNAFSHPRFFRFAIELARGFAKEACDRDLRDGIVSLPVILVIRDPEPEVTGSYCMADKLDQPLAIEGCQTHRSLDNKIIGRIDDVNSETGNALEILKGNEQVMDKLIAVLSEQFGGGD